MMIEDHERNRDDSETHKSGAGEKTGEDEGSSANEGREDHLKEDQKTTSR
jgi:hypothetical protein